MFDLALDSTGDLIFTADEQRIEPFRLKFYVSKGSALRLNFNVIDSNVFGCSNNGLAIQFDITNLNNNKRALTFQDDSAMAQAIKIRLLTALGDITGRETIGSSLNTLRHKSLYDTALQTSVINAVTTAISDILVNVVVKVVPVSGVIDGVYTQSMQIYIYDNDYLIFNYTLKG